MIKEIVQRLSECVVIYPTYGDMTEEKLKLQARVFERVFRDNGLTVEQVGEAFDEWTSTVSGKYPDPAGLVSMVTPQLAYRMHNGPNGRNALYSPDHPYVRLQIKLGQQLKAYETWITPAKRRDLDTRAALEAPIEPDYTMELPRDDGPRRGGGLKRIGDAR